MRSPTTAGKPSDRARIATCDVRVPASVAMPAIACAIELHRQTRRQIVRDENRVRALGEIDRIVIGKIEQQREDANLDVLQIADSLAQHRMRVSAEPLRPLEHHDLERFLGAEILPDQLFDGRDELLVVENRALHVEDRRFLRAGRALRRARESDETLLARDRAHRADAGSRRASRHRG